MVGATVPKTYPVRNAFNAGEISELVSFRDDIQKYSSACLKLENAVPLVEGGAKKMPGTYFAGPTAMGGAQFVGSITGTTLTVGEEITSYQNASGQIAISFSAPLGDTGMTVGWFDFAIPAGNTLPSDAAIQGIYPVMVGGAPVPGGFQNFNYTGPTGTFPFNLPAPGLLPGAGEFHGSSLGTDLSVIPLITMAMTCGSSIGPQPLIPPITTQCQACGIAIYYTSAVPSISSQIPPPFSVPSGQGVLWAIPFGASGPQVASFGAGIANPATPVLTPETETITGTIRVGQTVTGAGVTPGTFITGYIPTTTPLSTHFTVTANAAGLNAAGDWQYVGTQFRTLHEPVTTALSDLNFTNFGLSIPAAAVNIGITVSTLNISQSASAATVSQVSLWNGGQVGTIKTPATPFVPALVTESYGGATDAWGLTNGALLAMLSTSTFGFAVAVTVPDTTRVFVGQPFQITVDYDIVTMVPSSQPGGVGNYTVNNSQTVPSEEMQTASSGKSRLVPFQFSTVQGAILELSAGIVRIWEGASQGSWSLGLALQTPPAALNYNPATAYAAGALALVGPWAAALFYTRVTSPVITYTPNPSLGVLTFAAPYGASFSNVVPVTFTTNSTDALAVTITGTSPNQGINIALANTTPANNSAAAIQAAIRALGSLNAGVDLTQWTVTPDPIYNSTPWITAPTTSPGSGVYVGFAESFITQAVSNSAGDQFPVLYTADFNTTYWTNYSATAQLPIELVTPYLEADLFALDCSTQSADVLWIFHPSYPPAVIERLGANSWAYSLSLPGQQAGEPAYRGTTDVVTTGYSALGQNITLIGQAAVAELVLASPQATQPFSVGDRIYINLCSGMVELNQGEFIVAVMNYTTGTIPVIDSTGAASSVPFTGWLMKLTDPTTGAAIDSSSYLQYTGGGFAVKVVALFAAPGDYPACGTLYQERLMVGGSDNNPTQLNGSVEDDYPDFITDPNADDYAIQFTLVSNQVNQLLNMIGTPNALLIGTSGGVWVMQGSNGTALSQTNVSAAQQSTIGVSPLQPQLVNGSAIFVSRSTRIVTFLVYSFVTNAWENNDLTRLNRNITIGASQATSGIAQTAFQVEPYPIFWAVRNDGQLIGLVFNTQDQVYAWFRVDMTAQGGSVESVAVISGANQEDQLVVVVNRTIDGLTRRYVEYFMPQEIFGQLSNAFFVNCGLQLSGGSPVLITGITNANPPVVNASQHGFTDGMTVQITGVQGMTQINQSPSQAYIVANANPNNFTLVDMDTTAFPAYTGGGTVSQVFNQVSGMSYLLGNTVVAVGDGAKILPPTVVTEDVITFPYYANLITIGIPYQYKLQPTNPVLSSQAATTRGMPQKLMRVTLSLYQAMGGKVGTDLGHMYPLDYGTGTMAKTPTMSTKVITPDIDGDWAEESTFFVTQDDPLPFTLRGIVFRMEANQD